MTNGVKKDKYEVVQHIYGDYWFVIPRGEANGYITNSSEEILTEKIYTNFEGLTGGDFELVMMSTNRGTVTLLKKDTFSPILSPEYCIKTVFWEGVVAVSLNNKYGFADIDGNIVIPPTFDNAFDFSKGLAPVKLNDKYGSIDKLGNIVIPIIYDSWVIFWCDRAKVQLNGETFYINRKNEKINSEDVKPINKEIIEKEENPAIKKAVSESEIIKAISKEAQRIKEETIKECKAIRESYQK